jgi:hypothetical protein
MAGKLTRRNRELNSAVIPTVESGREAVMSTMKMMMAAASLVSTLGVAGSARADEFGYSPRYRDVDGRVMHARIELERGLASCGDSGFCRAHVWRHFRRELETAREQRNWREHEWRDHEWRNHEASERGYAAPTPVTPPWFNRDR